MRRIRKSGDHGIVAVERGENGSGLVWSHVGVPVTRHEQVTHRWLSFALYFRPLIAAALTGHSPIVELIIVLTACDRQERIDALELLGSTYVDKKRDMMGALEYWRRAINERLQSPPMFKTPPPVPVPSYDNAVEVTTVPQLEELFSDPDLMRMQALLVRERILGVSHPDTSYYIRYRGAVYADTGNFDRCIKLWMYALDMQVR